MGLVDGRLKSPCRVCYGVDVCYPDEVRVIEPMYDLQVFNTRNVQVSCIHQGIGHAGFFGLRILKTIRNQMTRKREITIRVMI